MITQMTKSSRSFGALRGAGGEETLQVCLRCVWADTPGTASGLLLQPQEGEHSWERLGVRVRKLEGLRGRQVLIEA